MERIRITAGKFRGRVILAPGGTTHPMGARERLALFNMISGELPGARVLDAFAGSGALGIEALSRGAKKVVFVEKTARVARIIIENLRSLGLDGEVMMQDVSDFQTDERFEVIIADPPYDKFLVADLAGLGKMLTSGGVLVLSHPGDAPNLPNLSLVKSRKYAGARISIYRGLEPEEQ